eukprot:807728-Rhodomonas_salina.1
MRKHTRSSTSWAGATSRFYLSSDALAVRRRSTDVIRFCCSQVREVDTAKAEGALSQLASQEQAEMEAKLARERELAKVKIDKADVDLIIAGEGIVSLVLLFPLLPLCCPGIVHLHSRFFMNVDEMEVDEVRAERVLREHNGEAIAALRFLVHEDTQIVRK